MVSRLAVLSAGLIASVLGFYVLQGALSSTPAFVAPYRNEVAHFTRQLAPQGWAFFTKDAQSRFVIPYAISDRGLKATANPVGASPRFAFGFNRAGRSQGAEIASLLRGVGQDRWRSCHSPEECADKIHGAGVETRNERHDPSICGEVLLVAAEPVPWEWRDLSTGPSIEQALRLRVRC